MPSSNQGQQARHGLRATQGQQDYYPELQSRPMMAMVYDDYGPPDVLHRTSLPIPDRLPGEVLIQVAASSINPIDCRLRAGELKGLLPGGFPRVPGYDVAGIVVDASDDGPFAIGDRVLAFLNHARGGACAEFALNDVSATCRLPDEIPFDVAAAMPLAGTTALQSLRDHGRMQPGDRVLINGASGGVGMFAVQIAKAYGCHVDAVSSGENQAYCMSLGADRFFDYHQTDFTKLDERWDVIFDAAGKASYWESRGVMASGSRFVTTEPDVAGLMISLLTWPLSKSGTAMLAKPDAADLNELIRLYQAGELKVTIEQRYALSDLAEAHRHLERGVEHGKIVITNE